MKAKSLLLFLLCVHVNAPLFGSLARRSEGYQILSGGRNEHDFDSVAQPEDPLKIVKLILPPLLHERGTSSPISAKSKSSDETLEFVRYELYNLNCKKNAKQYYCIIFNFNAHFVDAINLIHINQLKTLTGWILDEYRNFDKLSQFLNVSLYQLQRFALDILITRINCGCEESFKLLCYYVASSSRSIIKEISMFHDSKAETEKKDLKIQDIKSKALEILKNWPKIKSDEERNYKMLWKQQSNERVEDWRQTCCNKQNLSSKSRRFWTDVVEPSQWVACKNFETLSVCIRLLLTDEAGEAGKLKRLEEFAGCTFRADERLPLNFSETFWSVLSREEE